MGYLSYLLIKRWEREDQLIDLSTQAVDRPAMNQG